MEIIRGTSVAEGVVEGKLRLIRQSGQVLPAAENTADPETVLKSFREACEILMEELTVLSRKTRENGGEAEAEIFDIHRMMLEDEGFT